MLNKIKITFIMKILSTLIRSISPDVKKLIQNFIKDLEVKAQATKNPFDDILVDFLFAIFF